MSGDCKDCTPFSYCDEHEPPRIEHKVIGVCDCGADAHTVVEGYLVCFPCAYGMVN